MAGYTPDQLFAAYQTHLDRSNLTLTGITCQVTMRRESRMWSGVSRGDDVSATVDVSPAQRRVSFTLSIRGRATGPRTSEERSPEANSVGLRNCLTVALPATAYSSGYAALRSREELCRLVTGALPEAVSTTSADPGTQICTLTLPDGASGTIELFAEDLRTASLAQLLDGAPPRTEPYAPFFLDSNTGSCKVTMLTLPDGALRFSADDAAICTTFAQAAINQR